jgi:hypothetical protein
MVQSSRERLATRRHSPQSDIELMTEKQILGFEPASSRLEDVGAEHHEQVQDGKHR